LGTALISLGRYLGLEIYTTAEAKFHGQLHLLGASPINYEAEHFLRAVRRLSIDGAHAVFDCLGFTLLRSWDCLRPEGVLVSTGFMQAERSGGAGAGLFTQLNLGMNTVAGRGKKYINYEFEYPQWQHLWHQDLVHVISIVMSGKVDLAIAPSISPKKVPAFLSDMLQYKTPMGKTAVLWDAE
jgi:NADPH2:quinone reductase